MRKIQILDADVAASINDGCTPIFVDIDLLIKIIMIIILFLSNINQ